MISLGSFCLWLPEYRITTANDLIDEEVKIRDANENTT
jgi:hypothetical protein